MDTLEGHYRDMCDIEFTIEKGQLWILQTRIGKRTAFGEWVMAYEMLDEGLIDEDTALLRVDANRLEELFKRRVEGRRREPIAQGPERVARARPPARSCSRADEAEARAKDGERGDPGAPRDDARRLPRHDRAQGILTSAGGTNSHAAVVARGEGIPAVCGADEIRLDLRRGRSPPTARSCARATRSRSTGSAATSIVGELPLAESVLEKARQGDAAARRSRSGRRSSG